MIEVKFFDSAEFAQGLKLSTNGNESAMAVRRKVYFDALDNLDTLYKINAQMKNFDLDAVGNMSPSSMGVALAEATLKAQINSILGYVAIERSMTQMSQMLVYRDIITKGGASVMPLIGQDNPRTRATKVYTAKLTQGETTYSLDLESCVPGSLAITVKLGSNTYAMMDDRNGNILAVGGVLTSGTINYSTGALELEFADSIPASSTFRICYAANKELSQGNNRTTLKQGYFQIDAHINKFEYEADLITAAISQKTVGGDPIAELRQSVQDEATIAINDKLIETLKTNYAGNTVTIDLSAFSLAGGFADSMLKVLNMGLAAVDNEIAKRCWKATAATCYVVGNGVATMFMSMEDSHGWVANATSYVQDLIGFYKGRAVIRNLQLSAYEAFGLVKTTNGQLAPLGYGLLLPATNLPLVGNFSNSNEVASGIYMVDGVAPVAMALCQRFVLDMPNDWFVAA